MILLTAGCDRRKESRILAGRLQLVQHQFATVVLFLGGLLPNSSQGAGGELGVLLGKLSPVLLA